MKKVLVIDDHSEIRLVISESLNLYGFHSVLATDGASGVELACVEKPDLILCDINMPTMDGYQTLAAMRANKVTSAIPFIFLSGITDKGNVRRGMELGADDYLTKPFTPKELLAAVNTRLSKHAEIQEISDRKLIELRGNLTLALPHELRTPLNGILGLASLMMDDYETMQKQEVLESARFIHESALRLHRLIENFLVYSQMEILASEKRSIDFPELEDPVRVHGAIQEITGRVAERFKREADLEVQTIEAELFIPESNFRKIVEELVDNGFKFSVPGQIVSVISSVSEDTYSLVITDRGRGMSATQIQAIAAHTQFERNRFEQQGAGLGLIIAKRMTELMGGTFQIESQIDHGLSVRITFSIPYR